MTEIVEHSTILEIEYARSGREDELIYMSSALSRTHYGFNGTATVKLSKHNVKMYSNLV